MLNVQLPDIVLTVNVLPMLVEIQTLNVNSSNVATIMIVLNPSHVWTVNVSIRAQLQTHAVKVQIV